MKKALVHIGIEKTGTTTIQTCLNWNREILEENGIGFLKSPGKQNNRKITTYCMSYSNIDDHVRRLGISDPKSRQRWRTAFYKEFYSEITAIKDKVLSVIISSEHLHSRLKTTQEIEILKKLLTRHFETVTILVYLRRQDFLALSLNSTRCITGGTPIGFFPINIQTTNQYFNFKELLDKWALIFGKENIKVRIFDKNHFYREDLLQDFFSLTGIDAFSEKLKIPNHQNVSLSYVTQKVISIFNSYYPNYEKNNFKELNQLMRKSLIQILEPKFRVMHILPKREDAENFYNLFIASNNQVAKYWFNRDILFEDDFSMYPEANTKLWLDEEMTTFIRSAIIEVWNQYGASYNDCLLDDLKQIFIFQKEV